ncbi:MAG: hypothetical protein AAB090_03750 [Nitrospirota bacterium]
MDIMDIFTKKNQRGASLIIIIAIILIMGIIAAVFVSLINTESFTAMNQSAGEEAFAVAEGGLEYILMLRTFPNYSTGGSTIPLGAGNFAVETPAYLTAAVVIGNTTITVDSTDGFSSASGRIVIDSEVMTYSSLTPTTFTLVSGATAAHANGNAVYPVTTVSIDPGVGGTTITVVSTTGFLTHGILKIDSEYIYCAVATSTTFTNCTRGYRGTTPIGHAIGSNVFQYIVASTGTVTLPAPFGNAKRVAKVSVDRGGGDAITNGSFTTDIAGWTETITNTDGLSTWSNLPAIGGSPGSLHAKTDDCIGAACRNLRFSGFRSQGVSIPSGTNVTLQMDYCKNAVLATSGGSRMDTSVVIVYQGGATFTAWSDASQPSNPSCSDRSTWNNGTPPGQINVAFTTTDIVNQIRVTYDLRNRGGPSGDGSQKLVWFDEVKLIIPGGATALNMHESIN